MPSSRSPPPFCIGFVPAHQSPRFAPHCRSLRRYHFSTAETQTRITATTPSRSGAGERRQRGGPAKNAGPPFAIAATPRPSLPRERSQRPPSFRRGGRCGLAAAAVCVWGWSLCLASVSLRWKNGGVSWLVPLPAAPFPSAPSSRFAPAFLIGGPTGFPPLSAARCAVAPLRSASRGSVRRPCGFWRGASALRWLAPLCCSPPGCSGEPSCLFFFFLEQKTTRLNGLSQTPRPSFGGGLKESKKKTPDAWRKKQFAGSPSALNREKPKKPPSQFSKSSPSLSHREDENIAPVLIGDRRPSKKTSDAVDQTQNIRNTKPPANHAGRRVAIGQEPEHRRPGPPRPCTAERPRRSGVDETLRSVKNKNATTAERGGREHGGLASVGAWAPLRALRRASPSLGNAPSSLAKRNALRNRPVGERLA